MADLLPDSKHVLPDITIFSAIRIRVRPQFGFGFGYGAETYLTYGFGLVSATARVHWHKFGYGRNITPQRRNSRNCKIGANCNTVAVCKVNSLAVGGQSSAYASWYRRPETTSSHSLSRCVVCHPGHPAPTIMGVLIVRLQCTILSLSIGRQSVLVSISATVTAVSKPSVSAVVSVTAITGLQLRRHFRLRPKPEKSGFGRSLIRSRRLRLTIHPSQVTQVYIRQQNPSRNTENIATQTQKVTETDRKDIKH